MKISEIHITRWRNLRDVRYEVPADATLISLVGSNGTGKTGVLELLSFAAAQFGLAAGMRPAHRPSPPPDSEFRVVLTVAKEIEIPQDPLVALGQQVQEWFASWDRTLTLWHFSHVPADPPTGYPAGQAGTFVLAGGDVPDFATHTLANGITQAIQQRLELNHLFLDAERSYAPMSFPDDQILAASREDAEAPAVVRQRAVASTTDMYQEWQRSALGLEHRHSAEFSQAHREASARGEPGPAWTDPWDGYRDAVRTTLPQLAFIRPDQERKALMFEAGGDIVPYHELSGGEREVAFLTGQLLRFRLTRGLLLVDEPELHLNAELLERWLRWARDTVTDGQVWVATHSLEAVEVAGPENALVLERDADGLVRSLKPLSARPIMSTLAGALGAPAFSLDRQRFVLIEGERPGKERQRFAVLAPGADNLFLEAGNCTQVVAKLALITDLATESDRLHAGAVIDRDHWDARQRQRFTQEAPVHVLGVHEIENFLLVPEALAILAERNGHPRDFAVDILRQAADRFAGIWIAQRAAVRNDVDLGPDARGKGGSATWMHVAEGREAWANELSDSTDLADETIRPNVRSWISHAIDQYAALRDAPNLWAACSGKQVAGVVASLLGLTSLDTLERQVLTLITDEAIELPTELVALREYVAGLAQPIR